MCLHHLKILPDTKRVEDKKFSGLFIRYTNKIRDIEYLTDENIRNIRSMTDEEKMYIIITQNNVARVLIDNYDKCK